MIGSALIASKSFRKAEELDAMRDQTLIPPGSKFDCHGKGKWCYDMKFSMEYSEPIPLASFIIVKRNMSWALLEEQET